MKTSRWFGIGLALAVIGLLLLAHNRSVAHNQAATLVTADAAGSDVSTQVSALKQYVGTHMGASVSFTLNGAYAREQQAAQTQAQPQTSGNIYQQAQAACASIKNAVQQAHCNQNYLNSHLQAATPTPVSQPNKADFTYTYTAPAWTPDAAGIVIAVSVIMLLVAAGRLTAGK